MNDVTFLEAARKLAERMMAEGGASAEERVSYGYRLVLARAPDAARRQALLKALERLLGELSRRSPVRRAKFLKQGESRAYGRGWTRRNWRRTPAWPSLLLNLDETVTKE